MRHPVCAGPKHPLDLAWSAGAWATCRQRFGCLGHSVNCLFLSLELTSKLISSIRGLALLRSTCLLITLSLSGLQGFSQATAPSGVRQEPNLSVSETLKYINDKVAEHPSAEFWRSECSRLGPSDSLSVSRDGQYILHYKVFSTDDGCEKHTVQISVTHLYLSDQECRFEGNSAANGSYLGRGENSSIVYCGSGQAVIEDNGLTSDVGGISYAGPREQGIRIAHAFYHLTKLLKDAMPKLDPDDPFAAKPDRPKAH